MHFVYLNMLFCVCVCVCSVLLEVLAHRPGSLLCIPVCSEVQALGSELLAKA